MSMTTTSASCFSATPRATVAPTLPAPPTTVTFRFIYAPRPRLTAEPAEHAEKEWLCVLGVLGGQSWSHVLDDCVAKLGCLQLRRAVHEAREVVRHTARADCAFHAFDDQVRHF